MNLTFGTTILVYNDLGILVRWTSSNDNKYPLPIHLALEMMPNLYYSEDDDRCPA